MNRFRIAAALAIAVTAAVAGLYSPQPADACGGLFSEAGWDVVQQAQRIIFTQNGDGTVSAYMQLEYSGDAEDFSWVLPLPEAIEAEDVEVPEGAGEAFEEIERATDPVFVVSEVPRCAKEAPSSFSIAMGGSAPPEEPHTSVRVYTSGQVGPYEFDVIGSEEPGALVSWLRENRYSVTPEMVELIDLYVKEGFVFLAMKLRQAKGETKPVKVTYPAQSPMIPMRIAAVAASWEVEVMVWIYADRQAVPQNYARMEIADEELEFHHYEGYTPRVRVREKRSDDLYIRSNYKPLMQQKVDELGGRAFITEYAGPASDLSLQSPLLKELSGRHPYLTRLKTIISRRDMLVDPVFGYDGRLEDVSNVRDLTGMDNLFDFDCDSAWLSTALAIGTLVLAVIYLLAVGIGKLLLYVAPVALIVWWLVRWRRRRARSRGE